MEIWIKIKEISCKKIFLSLLPNGVHCVLALICLTYFPVDPPSPVDCPVAGRYKFKQIGGHDEKYFTRVEGITVRPRHQIDCREYTSEFRSCYENTKIIQIDVEYCDTVDHNGRPIGEYGKTIFLCFRHSSWRNCDPFLCYSMGRVLFSLSLKKL